MTQHWTQELVIRRILERGRKRLPLNYSAVVQDDEPLNGAARRHFGSWDRALEATGIDPAKVKNPREGTNPPGTWSEQRIVQAIQGHAAKGADLAAHRMHKTDPKLIAAATAQFGSWRAAIKKVGFDYEEIRLTRQWPRERILERLKRIAGERGDLSERSGEAWDNGFVAAAVAAFGSWDKALAAAGVEPARRTVQWSRSRIIAAIRRGDPVEIHTGLRKAAIIKFGSWSKAVEAAGKPEDKPGRCGAWPASIARPVGCPWRK